MRERRSYTATRGWLSLVEGFGWAVLGLGMLAAALVLSGIVAGALGGVERTLLGGLMALASLSGGALMIAQARVGKAVCDIAENTARKHDGTPATRLRRDPTLTTKRPVASRDRDGDGKDP